MDRQMSAPRRIEPAHPLERLIFFSDAVFAIAITLLVIEIKVPHLDHGVGDPAHLVALAHLIPNFIGFFISFAVVGAFWAGHHRAFGHASRYAPGLIPLNLAMLCAIAFMPFATAYMSENFGERVPHLLYNGLLLATGLLNLRLVHKVTGEPYVDPSVPAATIADTRRRSIGVVGGALVALALSVVMPKAAQFGLMTVPLWQWLARRGARG